MFIAGYSTQGRLQAAPSVLTAPMKQPRHLLNLQLLLHSAFRFRICTVYHAGKATKQKHDVNLRRCRNLGHTHVASLATWSLQQRNLSSPDAIMWLLVSNRMNILSLPAN